MNEDDVRAYLRQTQARAYDAERRLEDLQDLRYEILTRRRGNRTGLAMHATGTVACMAIIRRGVKQQRERLEVLEWEAARARERLQEMEAERLREARAKERQREEDREREEEEKKEMKDELELARGRAHDELWRSHRPYAGAGGQSIPGSHA